MANQKNTKIRHIRVDGDSIAIPFTFDEQFGVWLGEYPFFKEEPRYTPSGRPWRNVSFTECSYHGDSEYNDCGTCHHLKKAEPTDLVGVCFHEKLQRKETETT